MFRLHFAIALRHLLARKRQSVVSLLGIVVGVAFFLAISSLMQGSEKDFIRRLVDNAPHIIVSDTFRDPRPQPAVAAWPHGVVEVRDVKPLTEVRGIRGYRRIVEDLQAAPGTRASAALTGQVILNFAGRDQSITLNGMVPAEIRGITTIEQFMLEGSVENLVADRDGILLGSELMRVMSLRLGDTIALSASGGQVRTFKIEGVFRMGRADFDLVQAYADLRHVQALLNRPSRANSIIIKLDDPRGSRSVARRLEDRIAYKSVSWQESFEDLMNTLAIRNIIMYSVVSAVLVVAAFGIFNVISTVVLEKRREIAILKSIGFTAADIRRIFLIQGLWLGLAGISFGLPLGSVLMTILGRLRLKPPGVTAPINLPIDWGAEQFVLAGAFALAAALFASWLPARRGAMVMPVDILRGGT